MNQLLGNILFDMYQYSAGLKKHIFRWTEAPNELIILAGTDTSGIVQWDGRKYHVAYEHNTNAIVITPN